MSCPPPYDYRPVRRSAKNAAAPVYPEHRSRKFTGGTYFRSIELGQDRNLISILLEDNIGGDPNEFRLTVKYNGDTKATYQINQSINHMDGSGDGISLLRKAVNGVDQYIEMPIRGFDLEYDTQVVMGETVPKTDGLLLSAFEETYLSGGNGAPYDAREVAKINTGPERTMVILVTTENLRGQTIDTPSWRKVKQWDGSEWINYSNLVEGQCPL